MATKCSNHFVYQLMKKIIDMSADTFKLRLMTSGFVFNEDNHAVWTDVSASELAAGNGYAAGGLTLTGIAVTEDDVNNKAKFAAADAEWTASGGSIGPTPGAILVDDTTADKTIVCWFDFNGNKTATDGNKIQVTNIEVKLET